MARKSVTKKRVAKKAKRPAKKAVPRKRRAAAAPKLAATPAGQSDKDHLIGVIQAGTDASKKAAGDTLSALLKTIAVSLKRNGRVQLVGFGSFGVTKRRARWGRNPATGERIRVKASKGVRFKAGASLKGSL